MGFSRQYPRLDGDSKRLPRGFTFRMNSELFIDAIPSGGLGSLNNLCSTSVCLYMYREIDLSVYVIDC